MKKFQKGSRCASTSLTFPQWRAVLRHSIPNVIEGELVPALLFIAILEWSGTKAAVLGALAFALGAMLARVARKQTITGLLWLRTLGLIARSIAALATGSAVIYFLQPTVSTALFGLAFLFSVPLGKPLVERLVLDFCPSDDETRAHPPLKRVFRDVSLWWGVHQHGQLLDHALAAAEPVGHDLVVVKSFTFSVAFVWFRAVMARSGTQVAFAPRSAGLRPATVPLAAR